MQPSRHEEVTVGVIGAEEIVHRTIAVARKLGNPSLRLVTAVYDSETDAYVRVAPGEDGIDRNELVPLNDAASLPASGPAEPRVTLW